MMMNSYTPLCFIALVATIQTLPIIDEPANNTSLRYGLQENAEKQYHHYRGKTSRHLKHIIDGTTHPIKAAGAIYRQRLRDDQCVVEYNGQYLTENSILQVRKKLYRVENCLLERVFHACGPNLMLMLNVVCRVVERHQTTTPVATLERPTSPPSTADYFHQLYGRANKTPRVITESCCENLCTISELSRYCHR